MVLCEGLMCDLASAHGDGVITGVEHQAQLWWGVLKPLLLAKITTLG